MSFEPLEDGLLGCGRGGDEGGHLRGRQEAAVRGRRRLAHCPEPTFDDLMKSASGNCWTIKASPKTNS